MMPVADTVGKVGQVVLRPATRAQSMSSVVVDAGQRRTSYQPVGKSRAERGMRSFTAVVRNPFRQDEPEMSLAEWNHPIDPLAPGRPNEALGASATSNEGVGVGIDARRPAGVGAR